MSTLLFFAGSAAFLHPRVARTQSPLLEDPPALPSVHSPANLASNRAVVASACLGLPHSAKRSGASR